MAKTKDINDPAAVTAFIQALDPTLAELAEAIRRIILSTDKIIGEQIKWNSPSFFYTGDMKPFDPKEYKRDLVVFNVRKGQVLLVFPTGAKLKERHGLLEGDYTDGRRMAPFKDMADVKAKGKALKAVVKDWLKTLK